MDLNIYDSKQEVAEYFSEYLRNLITAGNNVYIALSGGSTPKIVFNEIAARFGDTMDWSTVFFYWGDERCVPPDDEESNYKMTVDHLLSKIAIPKENIHRIKGELVPEEEAIAYGKLLDNELPKRYGIPQFDLVILGMGDDGHTASIFPHEIHLWNSHNNCELAVHPDSGQRRITITGKIINNAATVAFLVTGGSKSEKVKEIVRWEGKYQSYPASLVSPTSGKLLWFLDKEAAEGIIS
ncbi:MAG: 6-phosphogluconolactonase [Saonia sp.]